MRKNKVKIKTVNVLSFFLIIIIVLCVLFCFKPNQQKSDTIGSVLSAEIESSEKDLITEIPELDLTSQPSSNLTIKRVKSFKSKTSAYENCIKQFNATYESVGVESYYTGQVCISVPSLGISVDQYIVMNKKNIASSGLSYYYAKSSYINEPSSLNKNIEHVSYIVPPKLYKFSELPYEFYKKQITKGENLPNINNKKYLAIEFNEAESINYTSKFLSLNDKYDESYFTNFYNKKVRLQNEKYETNYFLTLKCDINNCMSKLIAVISSYFPMAQMEKLELPQYAYLDLVINQYGELKSINFQDIKFSVTGTVASAISVTCSVLIKNFKQTFVNMGSEPTILLSEEFMSRVQGLLNWNKTIGYTPKFED